MKCKEHPRYLAQRKPVKTQKHPDGCPICWAAWEAAKADPKRRLNTVAVELELSDARRLLYSLSRSNPVPALERLYQLAAVKNPVEARAITNSLIGMYSQLHRLKMLLASAIKELT